MREPINGMDIVVCCDCGEIVSYTHHKKYKRRVILGYAHDCDVKPISLTRLDEPDSEKRLKELIG